MTIGATLIGENGEEESTVLGQNLETLSVDSDQESKGPYFRPDDLPISVPTSVEGANDTNRDDQQRTSSPRIRRNHSSSLRVLGRWGGNIIRVGSETFAARLTDLYSKAPDEIAEFDIEDIPPSERAWIAAGSRFYWTVGYRVFSDGRRERASSIRMRRPTPVSESAVNRASEWADSIAESLGITESSTDGVG